MLLSPSKGRQFLSGLPQDWFTWLLAFLLAYLILLVFLWFNCLHLTGPWTVLIEILEFSEFFHQGATSSMGPPPTLAGLWSRAYVRGWPRFSPKRSFTGSPALPALEGLHGAPWTERPQRCVSGNKIHGASDLVVMETDRSEYPVRRHAFK